MQKMVFVFLCGVLIMDSKSSDSISIPTMECGLLLTEDAVKDQLSQGDELALIRINTVQEMHQGKKSHLTEYAATILKSSPEKQGGWSWLGIRRKEVFWHWGPAVLGKGAYISTFGKRQSDGKTLIDTAGMTSRVPENRAEEIFKEHRKISDSIVSRVDILPDSVLKAAARGEIDVAVLRITYSTLVAGSDSYASAKTDYRAVALRWLVGKDRENVAPLFKGEFTLKTRRIYVVAFSSGLEAPQPYAAVEVFPGNMEKSIRMHQDKIRAVRTIADSGVP